MAIDNRTNEPTPEQVEAAAKALRADEGFMAEVHSALEVSWSEYIARLVLVAAQGDAPQAESAPKSSYISPSLPAMIRNLWKSDPSENSVRTALKLAGDLIQELIDLKAAPVLPLSGVDEERLAEYTRVKQAEAWERNSEETEVGGSCSCCGITEVHRPQNPYRKGESDD